METKMVLAAIGVLVLATTGSGQNVLVNGSFETGALPPWQGDSGVTTMDSHGGDFSAYFADGASVTQEFQPIPVNRVAEVSFWLRHESLNSSPDGSFAWYSLWIETRDGTPLWGAVPLRPWTLDWQSYDCGLGPHPDCVIRGISFGGWGSYLDDVKVVVNAPRVAIDVKPGGGTNSINLRAGGLISVVLFGSETFDVHEVDQASLTREGSAASPRGRSGRIGTFKHVNGDSILDLTVRFPIGELALEPQTKVAELTGWLWDGTEFFGMDVVELGSGKQMSEEAGVLSVQVVPEPATLSLLVLGACLSLCGRRSRQAPLVRRRRRNVGA